jgi:hypothetical protein
MGKPLTVKRKPLAVNRKPLAVNRKPLAVNRKPLAVRRKAEFRHSFAKTLTRYLLAAMVNAIHWTFTRIEVGLSVVIW